MRDNQSLEHLNLCFNKVNARAALVWADILGHRRGNRLMLRLGGNPLGVSGAQVFARMVGKSLAAVNIDVSGNKQMGGAALEMFNAHEPSGLYSLDLANVGGSVHWIRGLPTAHC
jgi:hypothetical protein